MAAAVDQGLGVLVADEPVSPERRLELVLGLHKRLDRAGALSDLDRAVDVITAFLRERIGGGAEGPAIEMRLWMSRFLTRKTYQRSQRLLVEIEKRRPSTQPPRPREADLARTIGQLKALQRIVEQHPKDTAAQRTHQFALALYFADATAAARYDLGRGIAATGDASLKRGYAAVATTPLASPAGGEDIDDIEEALRKLVSTLGDRSGWGRFLPTPPSEEQLVRTAPEEVEQEMLRVWGCLETLRRAGDTRGVIELAREAVIALEDVQRIVQYTSYTSEWYQEGFNRWMRMLSRLGLLIDDGIDFLCEAGLVGWFDSSGFFWDWLERVAYWMAIHRDRTFGLHIAQDFAGLMFKGTDLNREKKSILVALESLFQLKESGCTEVAGVR